MPQYTKLRQAREKRGLSIVAFAREVGVAPLTVRYWERGVATPRPENITKIEEILGRTWKTLSQMEEVAV